MRRPHPALEKPRDSADGEWFLRSELDDHPQMVERTTDELGPSEAVALLMRVGVSEEEEAQRLLTSARRVFAEKP